MGQCQAANAFLGSTQAVSTIKPSAARRHSLDIAGTQVEVTVTSEGTSDQPGPTFSEQAEQQWRVFNELDCRDEADMMQLATFFQTLAESRLIKDTNMGPQADSQINVDNIKISNVGRLDSVIHNLKEFKIPPKGKVTLDIALDILDCFRRGGRLSTQAVHKILKDAYWLFKRMPNVRQVNMTTASQRCTVVGDLHGQFADLLYIVDTTGMPSDSNRFVFNGDFVDRGPDSLAVILTLFALALADPKNVNLNRGNHEDAGICCVFGFMRECLNIYDEVTFSMFVEVFRYLPLATVINGQVLILHGGLFSSNGVLLEEILEAPRQEYNLSEDKPEPEGDDLSTKAYLDQIVRDMLWSDPYPAPGRRPNPRGEGVQFGPDVTEEFLLENDLRMVVRSHECVPFGFGQPFDGERKELLCTIFSASNYSSSGNHGAFLRFSPATSKQAKEIKQPHKDTMPTQTNTEKTKLFYSVVTYYIGDPQEQEQRLQQATQASLATLIMKKRTSLENAFRELDIGHTGVISKTTWCEVLSGVTRLQLQWDQLLPLFLPAEYQAGDTVNYRNFLNNFQLQYSGVGGTAAGKTMFDALYVNRKQLEAMFAFFDTNHNGSLSREEFRQGCDKLNELLPPDEQLRNVDHVLDLIDFDRSGTIEPNEFFEAFRLLDLKDGKLDGSIGLEDKSYKTQADLRTTETHLVQVANNSGFVDVQFTKGVEGKEVVPIAAE